MRRLIIYLALGLQLLSFQYLFDGVPIQSLFDGDPEVYCRWYWVMPGTENEKPPFNQAGCWRWCDENGNSQQDPDEVVKVPDSDCCTYANICF